MNHLGLLLLSTQFFYMLLFYVFDITYNSLCYELIFLLLNIIICNSSLGFVSVHVYISN